MKKPALLITKGKIVTPSKIFSGDIVIEDGKITEIFEYNHTHDQESAARNKNYEIIDVDGNYVLPGLIDVHVHFRTPGQTHKEDWLTGSKASLAGGVTTVIDMPNTVPPTTTLSLLEEKIKLIDAQTLIHYRLYAGATNDNLEEIQQMSGIVGVKVFLGSSTGNLLVQDMETVKKLLVWSEKSGKIIAFHAEKETCLQEHWQEYSMQNRNQEDASVHSKVRPKECALEALEEILILAKEYKAKIHICHVSTREEVTLLDQYKKQYHQINTGSSVTAEVTPHHLFLNTDDYTRYGNFVKMNPPLRTLADQEALWEGLKNSTLDMVATDHAPHLAEEKQQVYESAPSGIPGVQTMLPLLLNTINTHGTLDLQELVKITSFNPAQRFGLATKGVLAPGYDADIVIVDMKKIEKVCHHFSWSKANWSPFHGWLLQGWPVMTFVGGKLMYQWRDWFGARE